VKIKIEVCEGRWGQSQDFFSFFLNLFSFWESKKQCLEKYFFNQMSPKRDKKSNV
jgi:hypothetical protein